ncbi:protein O-mannosyl-transferase TMTC3 [Caerostris extrusa]|uniref:Protein O-mannosyl-transferase TMTC3 n=1 Tax=Caerostris extrusa TaxID=172846 RepID=A0AAV4MDB8_CAEEX|nr:protein O-mannosyl-transferase TMTC3 [Caerostris extrusa]
MKSNEIYGCHRKVYPNILEPLDIECLYNGYFLACRMVEAHEELPSRKLTNYLICHRQENEETLFRSGLRITKANAKLFNNLGHVMESEGRNEDALQLFLKAVEVQPDDLGSHLNVGRMYNILGQKPFCLKVQPGKPYRVHIVPRHLDLFLNLGNLLSKNLQA